MNKEQQQIIDEAYEKYEKNAVVGDVIDSHYVPATDKWNLYNKEEFIFFNKKDDRFAKKWGLQIEERELSDNERYDLCAEQKSKMSAISEEDYIKYNIPTKLITITYKKQTITSYE